MVVAVYLLADGADWWAFYMIALSGTLLDVCLKLKKETSLSQCKAELISLVKTIEIVKAGPGTSGISGRGCSAAHLETAENAAEIPLSSRGQKKARLKKARLNAVCFFRVQPSFL
jgi:hypothetical protein